MSVTASDAQSPNGHVAKSGAAHHRGESRQDFETPPELIRAVAAKFGALTFDLAAVRENAKAPRFIGPDDDSLRQDWSKLAGHVCWLNPPFADIAPWARKCAEFNAVQGRILLLTPGSVGSNWWAESVHERARVLVPQRSHPLRGRQAGYPKDCTISVFGAGVVPGYEVWRWPEPRRKRGTP